MNKILTVIIPTYNMEKYLRKCLDSLIVSRGCMEMLEVLVVNDGSKDSSSSIGHEYERNYPDTFRVIDKENGNYGSCINRGLKEAKGKYIKVLDADDYVKANNFNEFINFLKVTDADLVVSDFDCVDSKGRIETKWTFSFPKYERSQFLDFANSFDFKDMSMHAIAYNRFIFQNINYKQTEGISFTDQEWMFYPMIKVETFCYFPKSVYQYLIGREGQTVADKNMPRVFDQHRKILLRALEFINNKEFDDRLYEYLQYRILFIVAFSYKHLISSKKYDDLRVVENRIKSTNPRFYSEMNDAVLIEKILPYRFIKAWRNRQYISLNVMMMIYKMLTVAKDAFNYVRIRVKL